MKESAADKRGETQTGNHGGDREARSTSGAEIFGTSSSANDHSIKSSLILTDMAA